MRTVNIYRIANYRWSNEMADPHYDDAIFTRYEQEAMYIFNNMTPDVGYYSIVERSKVEVDEWEDVEEDDLEELFLQGDISVKKEGEENLGEKLNEEGYIVYYRHHRYMNYAYDITGVEAVSESKFKNESDLINDSDSTTATYCDYYESLDELQEAYENGYYIFAKIHSGSSIIRELIY